MTVSLSEWRGLLKYAYELDLNKGSYYDGRLGAINFWCGPKDKPSDWPEKIVKGMLKYPREYVGAVFGERTNNGKFKLHFEISAYQRADIKGFKMGSAQWQKVMRGTRADRQWVLRQFRLLRQHVKLMRHGIRP